MTTATKTKRKARVTLSVEGLSIEVRETPSTNAPATRAPAGERARTKHEVAHSAQATVACPTCKAPPGAKCEPGGDRVSDVHRKRWRAYERTQNAPKKPSPIVRGACNDCGTPIATVPVLADRLRTVILEAAEDGTWIEQMGAAVEPDPDLLRGLDVIRYREHRCTRAESAKRAKPPTTAELERARVHPERAVPCPDCKARVGSPCRTPSGHKFMGTHTERRDAIALDRRCPECQAEPGEHCLDEAGEQLVITTRGTTASHAARRTAELALEVATTTVCSDEDRARGAKKNAAKAKKPKASKRASSAPVEDPSACMECGHRECPIYPDCSGCSACAAARDPEVEQRIEIANERMEREIDELEGGAHTDARAPEPSPTADRDAWRDLLELPPGPITEEMVLAAHQRLDSFACGTLGGEPCRARRAELQWARLSALRWLSQTGSSVVTIARSRLRRDGGTQSRAAIDPGVVEEYADAYTRGIAMPPLVAFFDGTDYWLANGFHRDAALDRIGASECSVDIRQGTRRDAVLFSAGANQDHGLRRSNADKRRAVELLLRDEEWQRKTDRWIASHCGVTHPFVAKIRAEVVTVTTSEDREGRDGKSYPVSQPSRPPAKATTRTRVEYDGEPGPDEPAYEPSRLEEPSHESAARAHGDSDDASLLPRGDASLERAATPASEELSHGAVERIDPVEPSRVDERPVGPASAPEAKPRKWREVLELPAGPVDATLVVEHHGRLTQVIGLSADERVELDRAKQLALSQWETMPDLADRMVELAGIAGLDSPLVIEPSAGSGQLVEAVRRANPHAHIVAYEIDPVRIAQLRAGSANEVFEGDYLARPLGETLRAQRGIGIANTPYEGGADGRFLERMMRELEVIVPLVRLNALTGDDRCERVWSRVQSGEWLLPDVRLLRARPAFSGPGDDSARSDYVVVRLVHSESPYARGLDGRTKVDWW